LLITFCDQAHQLISYSGYELQHEDINALVMGSVMPAVVMNRIHSVAWYPDDYACFSDKVTKEIEDWPSIKRQYEASKYESLINEALYGKPDRHSIA